MFDEIKEIIAGYDRDKRPLAEAVYNEMFESLQTLDLDLRGLSDDDPRRPVMLNEMKVIAGLMQELNYAACQFEHERVSDLADECPPRYGYGSSGGVDVDDSYESLLNWLRLHFPLTWPR